MSSPTADGGEGNPVGDSLFALPPDNTGLFVFIMKPNKSHAITALYFIALEITHQIDAS